MARYYWGESTGKFEFKGGGIVLESEVVADATYLNTIIAPAVLFKRTDDILPHQVQFDVCLSDNKLYKGKLVACDFHYNLAAITIQTNFRLQPATLTSLNDVSSINIDAHENPPSHGQDRFQLRPHSNLFKVQSGTDIILLNWSLSLPFSVGAACGVFRASHVFPYSCKELYWFHCDGINTTKAGEVIINLSGQVMGTVFNSSSFLPSNFISRWWNHYKSKGKFCRPWVGVEIANLAEAQLSFLEQLRNTFYDIGTGVIVTKVEKDTPAYCAGIRLDDVIVKCGGKQVQSKIEFFESMWDNAGKSTELTILRASDRQPLDLCMPIGETTPTNFYRWELPYVTRVSVSVSSDELSDASSDELSDASSDELSDASADRLSEGAT